jgi:hypothetical protein
MAVPKASSEEGSKNNIPAERAFLVRLFLPLEQVLIADVTD